MISINVCPKCRMFFLRPGDMGNKPHCNCKKPDGKEDPSTINLPQREPIED